MEPRKSKQKGKSYGTRENEFVLTDALRRVSGRRPPSAFPQPTAIRALYRLDIGATAPMLSLRALYIASRLPGLFAYRFPSQLPIPVYRSTLKTYHGLTTFQLNSGFILVPIVVINENDKLLSEEVLYQVNTARICGQISDCQEAFLLT